ncbi:hypothetical protein PABG_00929 [Paracoccidioides brasiliensis Pb03]|nr:hypothetical protein PABG_00929 [Paracoccidioides brasiliensis Pb03]
MSWEEIDSAIHRSSKFRRDLLPQEALGVLVDSIKLSQEVKWELKEANARPKKQKMDTLVILGAYGPEVSPRDNG